MKYFATKEETITEEELAESKPDGEEDGGD